MKIIYVYVRTRNGRTEDLPEVEIPEYTCRALPAPGRRNGAPDRRRLVLADTADRITAPGTGATSVAPAVHSSRDGRRARPFAEADRPLPTPSGTAAPRGTAAAGPSAGPFGSDVHQRHPGAGRTGTPVRSSVREGSAARCAVRAPLGAALRSFFPKSPLHQQAPAWNPYDHARRRSAGAVRGGQPVRGLLQVEAEHEEDGDRQGEARKLGVRGGAVERDGDHGQERLVKEIDRVRCRRAG